MTEEAKKAKDKVQDTWSNPESGTNEIIGTWNSPQSGVNIVEKEDKIVGERMAQETEEWRKRELKK